MLTPSGTAGLTGAGLFMHMLIDDNIGPCFHLKAPCWHSLPCVMRHVVAGRTRHPTSSRDDDESKAEGRRPPMACPRPVFVVLLVTLLLLLLLGIAVPEETATAGGRFSGLTISPSAVAAGATVSYAVAGMQPGERLRFAPSGGGADGGGAEGGGGEVFGTLAANGSVTLALPTVATYRVWRTTGDRADTGLRVVAAEPWPPEPAQSAG